MNADELRSVFDDRLRNSIQTDDDIEILYAQLMIEIAAQLAEHNAHTSAQTIVLSAIAEEVSSLNEKLIDLMGAALTDDADLSSTR